MSVSEREQAQQWQKKDQHDDDDNNDPVSLVELPGSRVGEFLSTRKWPGFSDGIVVFLLHRDVLLRSAVSSGRCCNSDRLFASLGRAVPTKRRKIVEVNKSAS
jgi:hypothetical protein